MSFLRAFSFFSILIFSSCNFDHQERSLEIKNYNKALYQIPGEINPVKSLASSDNIVNNLVFNGLFKSKGFQIVPSLVKSWKISDDQKTYKFILRDNVFAHDGSLLTAEDVKVALQIIKKDSASLAPELKKISNISASGNQLSVSIYEPYPSFISLLSGSGIKVFKFKDGKYIGTGPFVPVSIAKNEIKLKRFTKYFLGLPSVEYFNLIKINSSKGLELMNKGKLHDMLHFTSFTSLPESLESYVKPTESYPAATWLFSFNSSSGITKDKVIRKCFSLGYDKSGMVKNVLASHIEARGYLPPQMLGANKKLKRDESKEQCEKFKGTKVELDLPVEFEGSKEICQYAKRHEFFDVSCNIISFDKLLGRIGNKKFNISFLSMSLDNPSIEYFVNTFTSYNKFNLANYQSDLISKKINEFRNTLDREKKASIFAQINQHLFQNYITDNISYPKAFLLRHSCLEGVELGLMGDLEVDYNLLKISGSCKYKGHFL